MQRVSIDLNKFEQLLQTITPGSTLLKAWPLQGGISAEMTAFEIKRTDGQISRMILRRPSAQTLQREPQAAEVEFKILQLTKSFGLATQTPYFLGQAGTIISAPYLVIEYIDGEPQFPLAAEENFLLQMAEHLAKIHRADISRRDISFLPKQANRCPEVPGRLSLNHPALDVGNLYDLLEKITTFPERNTSVLLHGDYWPGNLLWRDNTLVAVIDWEDAKLGDPLIDFAISRLDILCIFGRDAMRSYAQHYESLIDIDCTDLPYWDLCAALRLARLVGSDLTRWVAFFRPFGRSDITKQSFREHFQFFVTQALEKLAK